MNEPLKPLKRAYREVFDEIDLNNEQNLDELPSLKKFKPALYRARRKRLPKLPHTMAEVLLPEEWTTTEDGRNFLLANDGEEERILIFGTSQNVRHLCAASTTFMDGTFKISPKNILSSLRFTCSSPGYHGAATHLPSAFKNRYHVHKNVQFNKECRCPSWTSILPDHFLR